MSSERQRWVVTIACSLVVHTIFCPQAVAAACGGGGSMVADELFFIAFLPHYMVMYFSPPAWPMTEAGEINGWRFFGKLAVSYPASLLYGWILGAFWHFVLGIRRRPEGSSHE